MFLDDQKLFSAETYTLGDATLYNIPFRIDINYKCLSKNLVEQLMKLLPLNQLY